MYGMPCDVSAIARIAESTSVRSRPLSVVYDAAHAFGSAVNDRKVGTFGNAEVFSLSVTKPLVSVEGGLVSSLDRVLIERIRKMRNYGIEANYDAHWRGFNGKMSEFHAIVGVHNVRRIDTLLAARRSRATYFLAEIRRRTSFGTLAPRAGTCHTFKDFTVVLPRALAKRRPQVAESLKHDGIETRAYFSPPVHQQKLFREFADRPLPVTEALAPRVLTLPFSASITEAEIDRIVDALCVAETALADDELCSVTKRESR
jgi:dTDP-4-amino-4,6-dideoxygalactose transaminase